MESIEFNQIIQDKAGGKYYATVMVQFYDGTFRVWCKSVRAMSVRTSSLELSSYIDPEIFKELYDRATWAVLRDLQGNYPANGFVHITRGA